MKTLKKLLLMSVALILVTSCSKEDAVEREAEIPEGKIPVKTEVIVDGVLQTNTRASTEAGYTTGDGLYDITDRVTVAAFANDGYELAAFYDKKDPSTNLGASHTFDVLEPRTFKAEFARKYTITVSASPTAGGTVSGGGKFRSGKTCTLTAAANAGYSFDGWYEGSTKLSSSASYSFTVSSNRTITGLFLYDRFAILVHKYASGGKFMTPTSIQSVGIKNVSALAYGNSKYIVGGGSGINSQSQFTISTDNGVSWSSPVVIASAGSPNQIIYSYSDTFVMAFSYGYILTSNNGGISWKTNKVGDVHWRGIVYANGKYVAVGVNLYNGNIGCITASIDGQTWTTPQPVGTNGSWNSVTYGNGKYVAVGDDGYITTSADGVNWTTPIQVGSVDWKRIKYISNMYVTVGYSGYIATSVDGITWTNPQKIGNITWDDVTYSNGTCFVVGSDGYFTKSNDLKVWITPRQMVDYLGNTITDYLANACPLP